MSVRAAVGKPQRSEPFEKLPGFVKLREQFFFRLKVRRMHAAAAATELDRMLQVKHFVIDDVLHRILRNPGVVENPAYHNRVVRGIVMSKAVAGVVSAPGHLWTREQSVEVARV